MSKSIKFSFAAFAALLMCNLAAAGSITFGNDNNGNCIPLNCNVSGTSSGQVIDYQQVYKAPHFGGAVNISSISFISTGSGGDTLLGGTYKLEWGYAPSNALDHLSTTLASNYSFGGPTVLETFTVPAGGIKEPSLLTFNGFLFNYNPAIGDLLLEIIVSNQDNVSLGSPNTGSNEADFFGTQTSRAYCSNTGCVADDEALVTEFGAVPVSTTPEPSSLLLFGTCLLGLAPVRRKLLGR
jgi:PEP-CTERM motif